MRFTAYMKEILSAESEASSKRFISIYSLGLFTIVIIASLFGIKVEDSIIYALVSLILGSSVMTLVQNNSTSISKSKSTTEAQTTQSTVTETQSVEKQNTEQ